MGAGPADYGFGEKWPVVPVLLLSSGGSTRQDWRSIRFAFGQYRPRHAGELVCQCNNGDVAMLVRHQPFEPTAQARGLLVALLQHRTSTLYEEPSQIRVATLADAEQSLFSAGRVFAGNKANPG